MPSDPTKKPSISSSGRRLVSKARVSLFAVGLPILVSRDGGTDVFAVKEGESRFCLFETESSSTGDLRVPPCVFPIAGIEACLFNGRWGVADVGKVGGR